MENNTNSDGIEMPSSLRNKVNSLHDSNKGVLWVVSTLIAIFLGGGVIYKTLPLIPEEIRARPIRSGDNNTILINQTHSIAPNIFKIITPIETSDELDFIAKKI